MKKTIQPLQAYYITSMCETRQFSLLCLNSMENNIPLIDVKGNIDTHKDVYYIPTLGLVYGIFQEPINKAIIANSYYSSISVN